MINLKEKFLNILFPRDFTCDLCGNEIQDEKNHVCNSCLKTLPYIETKTCMRCGGKVLGEERFCIYCKTYVPEFFMARAPFVYTDIIAGKIKAFKYDNQRYLAETFAQFMANTYIQNDFSADVIVPIPLHKKRLKKRGFNQAELLSNELSKLLGIPVVNALERIKETAFQASLNYNERQENLKGSFKVVDKTIKNKKILLVDDIYTTGATVKTASEVLRNDAKTGRIYVLTIAHTNID